MNDTLTDFVDQLNVFPTLEDFNASSYEWSTKVDRFGARHSVYQIVSTRIINMQHGQSIILSLHKADRSCCSACACGMLTKELQRKPMVMVNLQLFVWPTGLKMSKIGRVYNSYQLLQCWLFVSYLCNICRKMKFTSIFLSLCSSNPRDCGSGQYEGWRK